MNQGMQYLTSGSMDLINTEGLVFEDLKPQVKVSRIRFASLDCQSNRLEGHLIAMRVSSF